MVQGADRNVGQGAPGGAPDEETGTSEDDPPSRVPRLPTNTSENRD